MNVALLLPRYVVAKRLGNGQTAFYFRLPKKRYRDFGCSIPSEPLETSYVVACGEVGNRGRAAILNGLFDEWDAARNRMKVAGDGTPRIGTVDWLFREYKRSKANLEKVAPRSRRNYEWVMKLVADTTTKHGDRIGGRSIKSITPRGADKIYDKIIAGPKGARLRQGEKAVVVCRKAWRVVHLLYPNEFNKDVMNPWAGVTLKSRVKLTKAAVTREQVYTFAHGCIERGEVEAAAAAVIVLSGYSAQKT
jgi:hypothetical protein